MPVSAWAPTGPPAAGDGGAHIDRVDLQAGLHADLSDRVDVPVLDLPQLTSATFDVADLEILADVLADQVGEDGPRVRQVPGWLEARAREGSA
jgi:hypothetical protein